MNSSILDVIVIGAGHAGLSISHYLKKLHLSHVVFEKGRIGNTWRNQRWDSFKLNTPNKVNLLPGQENGFTMLKDSVQPQNMSPPLSIIPKNFNCQ